MQPKISIIIPVYNVSADIERCVGSVLNQSIDSLEIIVIDDCSLDDSIKKIENLTRENHRSDVDVKIIRNSENKGLAATRRIGILEAKGLFIAHLDGDDWVDADYYKKLYDRAYETSADIVIGDEVLEYYDRTERMDIELVSTNGKHIMENWYRNSIGLHCHNKLVRRSLYIENKIFPYDGLNMWEDNALFSRLIYFANTVVRAYGPVYHYNRTNSTAMTASYSSVQVDQMIHVASNIEKFFIEQHQQEVFAYTVAAFKYLAKLNLVRDSFGEYRRFKKLFPESDYISSVLDKNAFSPRGQIRFNAVRYGMGWLFVLLFKIRRILFK